MNRTDQAKAILWLGQIADQAKTAMQALRADLAAAAVTEYEREGAAPTWRIPDLGVISASVSREAVVIADEAAFTAWVAARYPSEVETVQRVRSAWSTRLLSSALPEGDVACTVDGEVIPGLAVRHGGTVTGVTVRPSTAARQLYAQIADVSLRQAAAAAGRAVPELPPAAEIPAS